LITIAYSVFWQTLNNNEQDAFFIKTDVDLMVGTNETGSIPVHSALVYPNPGGETLHIRTTEKGSVFRLFNLSGQEILQTKINNLITEVDCNQLNKSIYVWKLYKNSREIDHGKWIEIK